MMKFAQLLEIMSALRAEKGCPWDREQTRESLRPFIVEEAYEVIDAIDGEDPEALKEELGDLLFQIVFQCQIAREKGEFEMHDVIDKIGRKMMARHPHVFGKADYRTTEEVLIHWEAQKRKEGKKHETVIDGVPKNLPSLLRAHKLQDRASRLGFDWQTLEDVLPKLDEEMKEFRKALQEQKQDEIENELGDIFFVLVNISRFVGVDPEGALRKTISKFISRFRYIEMAAADMGKKLSNMTLAEMDELWDEAKAGE